jgi:phosphate uptake regulator
LRRIDARIRPLFDTCANAFRDDDSENAQQVVDEHPQIKNELAEYIRRIAVSDLSADMAVVYSSTARSLQRISAHLSNIASSVVQPFHRIRHDDDDD